MNSTHSPLFSRKTFLAAGMATLTLAVNIFSGSLMDASVAYVFGSFTGLFLIYYALGVGMGLIANRAWPGWWMT